MRWSSVLTICRLSISEPQHATLLCANELYAGGFTECLLLKISKGFERNNSRGNQSTAQIQQVKLPKSDPFGSDSFTLTYHYSQLHPPKKINLVVVHVAFHVLHRRVRRVKTDPICASNSTERRNSFQPNRRWAAFLWKTHSALPVLVLV